MELETQERPETAVSHEGGPVFTVGDWDRLMRFLVSGTGQGTFYASGKTLMMENAQVVLRCLAEDADKTILTIMKVSREGLAPSNDPAIMALAMAAFAGPTPEVRRSAWAAFPIVCRIGTHLFHFISYGKAINGGKWRVSRGGRAAIQAWYAAQRSKNEKEAWLPLLHNMLKYKERDGVSQRDVLKVYHPSATDLDQGAIFNYVMTNYLARSDGQPVPDYLREYIQAWHQVQTLRAESAVPIIEQYQFPREFIPTHLLDDVDVWQALSAHQGITAMIRNLPKMTSVGLFNSQDWLDAACDRLTDIDVLKGGRVHPIALLLALKHYQTGKSPNLTWTPLPQLVEALEAGVYLSMGTLIPTGKRIRCCVDTSGSMTAKANGVPMTAREVAAAMALVTYMSEPNAEIVGFSSQIQKDLGITKKTTITEMMRLIDGPAYHTYCRLPIVDALENAQDFDAFIFYTDSETADGNPMRQHNKGDDFHPFSHYLSEYRSQRVADARIVVVAAAATEFTLNDPMDPLGLDVAGFSAETPQIISSFLRSGDTTHDSKPTTTPAAIPAVAASAV